MTAISIMKRKGSTQNMFIEQLTKKQLDDFFGRSTSHHIVKLIGGETYLYVSYETGSMVVNHRLYDFEGSTIDKEEKWRQYLYTIFGDIYYDAYKSYLETQMSEKLNALRK